MNLHLVVDLRMVVDPHLVVDLLHPQVLDLVMRVYLNLDQVLNPVPEPVLDLAPNRHQDLE